MEVFPLRRRDRPTTEDSPHRILSWSPGTSVHGDGENYYTQSEYRLRYNTLWNKVTYFVIYSVVYHYHKYQEGNSFRQGFGF